ncbi:MAG: hypothetical protein ACE5IY_01665 [bacterium]
MKTAERKTRKDGDHPLLDVSTDDIIPYFMWDYRYRVGQIKQTLAGNDESRRLWLIADDKHSNATAK